MVPDYTTVILGSPFTRLCPSQLRSFFESHGWTSTPEDIKSILRSCFEHVWAAVAVRVNPVMERASFSEMLGETFACFRRDENQQSEDDGDVDNVAKENVDSFLRFLPAGHREENFAVHDHSCFLACQEADVAFWRNGHIPAPGLSAKAWLVVVDRSWVLFVSLSTRRGYYISHEAKSDDVFTFITDNPKLGLPSARLESMDFEFNNDMFGRSCAVGDLCHKVRYGRRATDICLTYRPTQRPDLQDGMAEEIINSSDQRRAFLMHYSEEPPAAKDVADS